jgi:hypothetical protein
VKRVASYSLFWCGRDEHAKLYTNGLKAICRAHHVLFPGWTWRIHHDGSIDNDPNSALLRRYESAGLVELVDFGPERQICRAMISRMMPVWDPSVEIVLCRDLDSLPTPREAMAVQQFVELGCAMHCLADHPQHGAVIMGGLCGFRSSALIKRTGIQTFADLVAGEPLDRHGDDQLLLSRKVWPKLAGSLIEHRVGGHPKTPGATKSYNYIPNVSLPHVPEAVLRGGDALIPFLGAPGFAFENVEAFYNEHGRADLIQTIMGCES